MQKYRFLNTVQQRDTVFSGYSKTTHPFGTLETFHHVALLSYTHPTVKT